MTDQKYGSHTMTQAWTQGTGKQNVSPYANNITRRNLNILEAMPNRSVSTTLASANIKALRLFRYICRILPFIIQKHEILHRINPLQAKIFVSNHFRQNSTMTNLNAIDRKIQQGYQHIHEAQWHFVNTGYLYKFISSGPKSFRDHGVNRLQDQRASHNKKEAPSGFLKSFYQGKPQQRKQRYFQ